MQYLYTYEELFLGVAAYLKKEQMNILQTYETFATIVSGALGGNKKGKTPDKVVEVSNAEQLQAETRRMLSGTK